MLQLLYRHHLLSPKAMASKLIGITGRDLSSTENSALEFSFLDSQLRFELTITASVVSLIVGLVTFWLFVKFSKRRFRHRLVGILLISDALKALWILVIAAANYHLLLNDEPQVSDEGNFCQAAGFLYAFAIETAGESYKSLVVRSPNITHVLTGFQILLYLLLP